MSLRFLTAGESHGKALVGILEGLPSGLEVLKEDIQFHLQRRKKGHGRGFRQKIEDDAIEILSGIRHGKSLGSPISILIENKDWKSWTDIMESEPHSGTVKREVFIPRPGHADLVGGIKYQHEDMRNVLERSSARETTIRVALATVARIFLKDLGIHIGSRVTRIGSVCDNSKITCSIEKLNETSDDSPVRCLDIQAEEKMIQAIDLAKEKGDTLGGTFEILVSNCPVGLGSYSQWDRRIEGELSQAIMSLNAIKAVEIGDGFSLGEVFGSQAHDAFYPSNEKSVEYKTNRAGGVTGGMTTGQNIVIRAAMKPIATLMSPLPSVNLKTKKTESAHVERSDTCAVPAAAVIGESLIALVIAKVLLDKFGSDSMKELIPRVQEWQKNHC